MRVLFVGTPEVALPSLRALLATDHEVVAVLTRPDAPAGRRRRLTPSPVSALAREHDLEVLTPASPREAAFQTRLRELAPDVCAVVAYGALLPPEVLAVPAHGWVNLHFSLLPAWRGAAPVQHALIAGDEITGASTFRIEQGLDTGPVLGVMTERVRPHDTTGDLLGRLGEGGAGLLVATLDGLESAEVVARPQPTDGISHAPKITTDDAKVDWRRPGAAIERRVRACTPDPGAWTTFRGERLRLGPMSQDPGEDLPVLAPGQLHVGRRTVHVGTGDGSLTLGEVTPPGKRAMPAPDWARGARPTSTERLGDG